ncbi:Polyunsaturated fatty acid 5-lipoxygenase [Geodia barretti]|nr:Polyunsaturated fatty acid 5-lipoxygenase [Geodia barretti]
MEAYAMGLMRNIPDAHPVYKLLRPHTRYTMAINNKARESLIGPNGAINATFSLDLQGQKDVFCRAGKKYSVNWSNIKRDVKARGVQDSSLLPFYHYRDDGIKIWDALTTYVNSIIDLSYHDDKSVKEDKELQSFAHDIHNNGFPAYDGSYLNGHDFPPSISTKAEIVEICTLIMFTGSAQHAAVNFGQYTYYSFVPNAPLTLHHPPPAEKGKLTFKQLMDALPNEEGTQNMITVTSLLSKYSSDEIFVGTYPAELVVEKEAKAAAENLRKTLEKITVEIEERNKALEVPYIYLLPKKIPNSITI